MCWRREWRGWDENWMDWLMFFCVSPPDLYQPLSLKCQEPKGRKKVKCVSKNCCCTFYCVTVNSVVHCWNTPSWALKSCQSCLKSHFKRVTVLWSQKYGSHKVPEFANINNLSHVDKKTIYVKLYIKILIYNTSLNTSKSGKKVISEIQCWHC